MCTVRQEVNRSNVLAQCSIVVDALGTYERRLGSSSRPKGSRAVERSDMNARRVPRGV